MSCTYFIKHKKHKNWRKLSLRTKVRIGVEEALAYIDQYAKDHLNDPADYEMRCVDESDAEHVHPWGIQ